MSKGVRLLATYMLSEGGLGLDEDGKGSVG